MSYESISSRTDEDLESFDRKENRAFKRSWSLMTFGLPGLALLGTLVAATIVIAIYY